MQTVDKEESLSSQIEGKQIKVLGTLLKKHNPFFEILEFYLLHLFTLQDLINDVDDNERYYPTSAKHDGTTLNIRKTEKNKGKNIVL